MWMDTCTNNPGYSYIYGTCNDSMVILTEGYRQKKKKGIGQQSQCQCPHISSTFCFTETGRCMAHSSLEKLYHVSVGAQWGNWFSKAKQSSLIVHVSTVLSAQDKQGLRCSRGGYISAMLTGRALFLLCHLPPRSADVTAATESGRQAGRGEEGRGAAVVGTPLHSRRPRNTERWIRENKYYVSTQLHLHESRSSTVLGLQAGFGWAHP